MNKAERTYGALSPWNLSNIPRPRGLPFILLSAAMCFWIGCDSKTTEAPGGTTVKPTQVDEEQANATEVLLKAPLPHTINRVEQRASKAGDWFEQMKTSGVDFAYSDGNKAGFYTVLETVGGGVAMIDFDADGDLDLFFPGGGTMAGSPIKVSGKPASLFRNDGDWKFTKVSELLGTPNESLYTHGVTVADYNRDGFPDVFVTGFGGCQLYRNEQGKRFTECSKDAGLLYDRWSTAAAWIDYNQDGYPDLYVANYCDWQPDSELNCTQRLSNGSKIQEPCGPSMLYGQQDYLWKNNGDGTFEEAAETAGIIGKKRGLGVLVADFDQDGWPDIYVANDVDENDLYYGGPDGKFLPHGVLSGVALSTTGHPQGSMGIDIGDLNGDGGIELFCANFVAEDNSLYRQVDKRLFVNVAEQYGVPRASRRWVGFGVAMRDFDGDGWQDLMVANGHVFYAAEGNPYHQPPQLFQNVKGGTFKDASKQAGPYFSATHAGRGCAAGDLDNDGLLDLVVVHQNDPVVLLRNKLPNRRWVRVQLQGTQSNRDAISARTTVTQGESFIRRWVTSGSGYLSQMDTRIILPILGDEKLEVVVDWPHGTTEVFSDLNERSTNVLIEGKGKQVEILKP
ncbi:MAG: CRTAC1 family protein [Pirellulales bacterium]